MLDKIFSGNMADTSRFSVPGLIVMALGVLVCVFAGRLAGGRKKEEKYAEHPVHFVAPKQAAQWENAARNERLYFAFKFGGLLITMIGALMTVRVFG